MIVSILTQEKEPSTEQCELRTANTEGEEKSEWKGLPSCEWLEI